MPANEILKRARKAAGLTQKALGVALGYPEETVQRFVSNWETEYRPVPRKHYKKICELLHIDPLDLI